MKNSEQEPCVWRIHIKSGGVDPVKFCLKHSVVGIGWPVSRVPKTPDEYMRYGQEEYRNKGDKGWFKAANAICYRMKVGDLVWCRDSLGCYYLGRISGEWEYRNTPEYKAAKIFNVRPCNWFKEETTVAGGIVRRFIPSATVQRIDNDTVKLFSIVVYNKHNQCAGKSIFIPNSPKPDVFSLLWPEDLEDIVGLYLQRTKKLKFIPSSRSRRNTTIAYEFELVDPGTKRNAYVQVKSGNEKLDPTPYYLTSGDFYLFSPAGYIKPSKQDNVICLDRTTIESFLAAERDWLPLNIRRWLDW